MVLKKKRLPQWVMVFIGLVIYSLSTFVKFYIPSTIPYFVEFAGFLVLIYPFLQGNYRNVQGNDRTILTIFLVWNLILILRGDLIGNFQPSASGILGALSTFIFDGSAGLAFFIPFIILMPVRLNSLYYFKRIGLVLCCVCILLIGFHWQEVVTSTAIGMTDITLGSGEDASIRDASNAFFFVTFLVFFLSFCYHYYKGYINLAFPAYLLVFFFVQILGGGRGISVVAFLAIAFYIIILYKYPISTISNHKINKWGARLAASAALAVFGYLLYFMIQNNAFEFLLHRFDEGASHGSYFVASNREILKRDLISDFNSNPFSWIFGRGVNGCFATAIYSINGLRDGIEYGYLHFILKGGIPYLLMYVYLLLHCAYLGIFRSRNLLCKAMAFYCLVNVVALYTATGPDVTLRYFLVWFSICLLERKQIREMSDITIYNYFNVKGYQSN